MPQTIKYYLILHQQIGFMSIQIHREYIKTQNSFTKQSVTAIRKIQKKNLKNEVRLLPSSEGVFANLIKRTPYPNFRFFCPFCSSLDVFITIDKIFDHYTVDCLDCKKRWIDSRLCKN